MNPLISIPHSSMQLSPFCLGAMRFGSVLVGEPLDAIYTAYREAGGNCIDTAHCYCFWLPQRDGVSERALGEIVRRYRDRDNVLIFSKGAHPPAGESYPRPDQYMSRDVIASDLAQSLDRLGFDSIDLYFLHRDDDHVPVAEIIDILNEHIAAGTIKSIGASNWSCARMQQANEYAKKAGKHGFVASQPQFSLAQSNAPVPKGDPANRFLTEADIAWHVQSQLPVICYTPTAGGYFATGGVKGAGGYGNAISLGRLERATSLGATMGYSANQIALAFLRQQKFSVIPILGTTSAAHLIESLESVNIALTPAQVRWLWNGEE